MNAGTVPRAHLNRPPTVPSYDAIIIGGGFYGCRVALLLRRSLDRVLLVEREPELLGRASLRNQARVHGGYHYPRSILTSLRSRQNYARFLDEYADCVDRSFPHYYGIARGMSKVTAHQFAEFCRRIEAPLTPAPEQVASLFDSSRIEAVFEVEECAFDAAKLRERVSRELRDAGVEVLLATEAARVCRGVDGQGLVVELRPPERSTVSPLERSTIVINATYSRLNHILGASKSSIIPAKHELTEMALVEPPDELQGAAVTVMDGPFFSLMPYPARGLFTLSHVRYTPHCSWHDGSDDDASSLGSDPSDIEHLEHQSRFTHMLRDAERYLAAMSTAHYVDSLWEVKTVMPRSEQDDSRPILLRQSRELPGLITVLGAKIDSVYDVEDAIASEFTALR